MIIKKIARLITVWWATPLAKCNHVLKRHQTMAFLNYINTTALLYFVAKNIVQLHNNKAVSKLNIAIALRHSQAFKKILCIMKEPSLRAAINFS